MFNRVVTFFDKDIKHRQYEGDTWKQIADDIVQQLPDKIFLSFDIDGLDPKLAPNSCTPVHGGFDTEQVYYLLRKMIASWKKFLGFDLVEVGTGDTDWDSNVGARVLLKLCNLLASANPQEIK